MTSLCVLGYCHLLSCLAVRCLVYVGLKEVAKESEAEEAGGAEKCASWLDRTTAWKLCVFTCYLFEHLLSSPGEGVGWGIDRRCLFSFFALSLSLCLDFSQHSPKRLSSKENLVFFLLLSQPHSLSLYRSLGWLRSILVICLSCPLPFLSPSHSIQQDFHSKLLSRDKKKSKKIKNRSNENIVYFISCVSTIYISSHHSLSKVNPFWSYYHYLSFSLSIFVPLLVFFFFFSDLFLIFIHLSINIHLSLFLYLASEHSWYLGQFPSLSFHLSFFFLIHSTYPFFSCLFLYEFSDVLFFFPLRKQ